MKNIASKDKDATCLPSNNPVSKDIDYLPSDILSGAIKYTKIAREKGELIPNDEVHKILATKLGWK